MLRHSFRPSGNWPNSVRLRSRSRRQVERWFADGFPELHVDPRLCTVQRLAAVNRQPLEAQAGTRPALSGDCECERIQPHWDWRSLVSIARLRVSIRLPGEPETEFP